ncbi:hypothetical protein HYC85_021760 [Camellia sinensis]|uniref:GAG-pre-integrase domain-containing protein n=1 Tax=Camellia sinensis TaxID=4442 RepID=A0A7J7GIH7_CAMSI|nr:hypothetical protein HYC85_021760 [Camellia sinensis]
MLLPSHNLHLELYWRGKARNRHSNFNILVFAGYGLSFFMFYSFVPFVLKMSGATMFNLSILTSDMWAVVIRIFFYHQQNNSWLTLAVPLLSVSSITKLTLCYLQLQVDWLYYLSFAIEVVGLVIYSKTEKDPIPAQALVDGNLDAQYQVLGEESAESTKEASAGSTASTPTHDPDLASLSVCLGLVQLDSLSSPFYLWHSRLEHLSADRLRSLAQSVSPELVPSSPPASPLAVTPPSVYSPHPLLVYSHCKAPLPNVVSTPVVDPLASTDSDPAAHRYPT